MAAGAAVVATDVTGLRDAVSGRGVLVPAGDVAAMAREAAALLADHARRDELAECAREVVMRTYAWGICAEAVRVLYRQVAAHR
jgi:glycosyltransferase involved in cell wall biosynthesis